jgi:nucleotide-binding universal stress UspA family protein
VAVIGPLPDWPVGTAPPRVVVGVDGRGWCSSALRFAFRAAAQRAVPVVAVHVWTPDLPADHEGVCGSPAAAEALTGALVDRTLAPARRAFPHVPVQVRITGTNPAEELVRASAGAAMVVVGSRARGTLRAGLFGSVGRSVVRRAGCPVVVVGPDRPTPPAPRREERHTGLRPTRQEPLHPWGTAWE